MNFVNAELTKIALNTYVTTKITFANMLMTLCEQLPGGDIGVVSRALGQDTRIGGRCLSGGLGYGGPCFPRDNQALSFIAREVGVSASLAEATDKMNHELVTQVVAKIRAAVPEGKTVGILGLAYKPDTVILEESHGAAIAKALADQGVMVAVYDPVAMETARAVLGDSVAFAASMKELLAQSDAVVITIPCQEFKTLGPADFPKREEPVLVFDCWRLLADRLSGSPLVRYLPFGVGAAAAENVDRLVKLWHSA
jgi:UDPglucose 6-dehydrogenase